MTMFNLGKTNILIRYIYMVFMMKKTGNFNWTAISDYEIVNALNAYKDFLLFFVLFSAQLNRSQKQLDTLKWTRPIDFGVFFTLFILLFSCYFCCLRSLQSITYLSNNTNLVTDHVVSKIVRWHSAIAVFALCIIRLVRR